MLSHYRLTHLLGLTLCSTLAAAAALTAMTGCTAEIVAPTFFDAGQPPPASAKDRLGANGDNGDTDGGASATGSSLECTGFATSCSILASTQCSRALGCHLTDECTGVASSCYGRSRSSCTSQQGCYWSSTGTGSCSGSATSCSLISQFSCSTQDGCRSSDDCEGTPWRCEELSRDGCLDQPGCRLQ